MDLAEANRIERGSLAELFGSLSGDEWDTPSLCSAWTVRDVLAHLVTPYVVSPTHLMVRAARLGGFHAATVEAVTTVRDLPVDRQLELLQASADKPFVPPLLGLGAPLSDAVVHGEDVRVPLRRERPVPPDHLRAVLDFATSWRASPVFLPRRRLKGVRLVATDLEWSAGSGAQVRGEAQQVMRAVFGRTTAAEGLTGDGLAVLARRSS